MVFVRYLGLVALVVWVGGLAVLGLLVAPATFRVLQAVAPATGRLLAGAVFGEVLRLFHLAAYACGAIVLVALFAMKFVGPPPRSFPLRAAITAAMLLVAAYSGVVVSAEIGRVQRAAAGPIGDLAPTDARRVRFESLHRRSTALMGVDLLGGLILLTWYARE
jgi:hypothetical protein